MLLACTRSSQAAWREHVLLRYMRACHLPHDMGAAWMAHGCSTGREGAGNLHETCLEPAQRSLRIGTTSLSTASQQIWEHQLALPTSLRTSLSSWASSTLLTSRQAFSTCAQTTASLLTPAEQLVLQHVPTCTLQELMRYAMHGAGSPHGARDQASASDSSRQWQQHFWQAANTALARAGYTRISTASQEDVVALASLLNKHKVRHHGLWHALVDRAACLGSKSGRQVTPHHSATRLEAVVLALQGMTSAGMLPDAKSAQHARNTIMHGLREIPGPEVGHRQLGDIAQAAAVCSQVLGPSHFDPVADLLLDQLHAAQLNPQQLLVTAAASASVPSEKAMALLVLACSKTSQVAQQVPLSSAASIARIASDAAVVALLLMQRMHWRATSSRVVSDLVARLAGTQIWSQYLGFLAQGLQRALHQRAMPALQHSLQQLLSTLHPAPTSATSVLQQTQLLKSGSSPAADDWLLIQDIFEEMDVACSPYALLSCQSWSRAQAFYAIRRRPILQLISMGNELQSACESNTWLRQATLARSWLSAATACVKSTQARAAHLIHLLEVATHLKGQDMAPLFFAASSVLLQQAQPLKPGEAVRLAAGLVHAFPPDGNEHLKSRSKAQMDQLHSLQHLMWQAVLQHAQDPGAAPSALLAGVGSSGVACLAPLATCLMNTRWTQHHKQASYDEHATAKMRLAEAVSAALRLVDQGQPLKGGLPTETAASAHFAHLVQLVKFMQWAVSYPARAKQQLTYQAAILHAAQLAVAQWSAISELRPRVSRHLVQLITLLLQEERVVRDLMLPLALQLISSPGTPLYTATKLARAVARHADAAQHVGTGPAAEALQQRVDETADRSLNGLELSQLTSRQWRWMLHALRELGVTLPDSLRAVTPPAVALPGCHSADDSQEHSVVDGTHDKVHMGLGISIQGLATVQQRGAAGSTGACQFMAKGSEASASLITTDELVAALDSLVGSTGSHATAQLEILLPAVRQRLPHMSTDTLIHVLGVLAELAPLPPTGSSLAAHLPELQAFYSDAQELLKRNLSHKLRRQQGVWNPRVAQRLTYAVMHMQRANAPCNGLLHMIHTQALAGAFDRLPTSWAKAAAAALQAQKNPYHSQAVEVLQQLMRQ